MSIYDFLPSAAAWIFDREETKTKRKAVCFLMSLVMALSLVPVTASADPPIGFVQASTAEELSNALATAQSGAYIIVNSRTFTISEDITVPAGVTLGFGGDVSSLTIPAGVTITVNGVWSEDHDLTIATVSSSGERRGWDRAKGKESCAPRQRSFRNTFALLLQKRTVSDRWEQRP